MNYFSVTDNTVHSLLVVQESPGGGPMLVNGVAYDVKVVTVTVANSSELAGNTAVVNKIPRTVPDAPRMAAAVLLNDQLVIGWTAPLSDGGNPIVSYEVSFAGDICILNSLTDTYCAVVAPTQAGEYVYEIVATNTVGSGLAVRGVYAVAEIPTTTVIPTTIPNPITTPTQGPVGLLPSTGPGSNSLIVNVMLMAIGLAIILCRYAIVRHTRRFTHLRR